MSEFPSTVRNVDGDTDGGADEWDLVLDDEFVKAGRTEASAADRAARAARIDAEHRRVEASRAVARSQTDPRPPGRNRARLTIAAAVVLALGWTAFTYWPSPGTRSDPEAANQAASATAPVSVFSTAKPLGTPPPVPAGKGAFRFMHVQDDGSGQPVAFDPCRKLHYVIRPDHAPPGGPALLDDGLAELSRVTGLVLVDDGATGEAPSDDRAPTLPRYGNGVAPVLIAWSNENDSPDLAGYIAGYSGPSGMSRGVPGSQHYVSGQVVLDARDFAKVLSRQGGNAVARAIVLHELGHLVGLAHVAHRSQIMFSETTPQVVDYAQGDLTGLARLGQGRCFT
jgi:hypothetical protein